MGVRGNQRLGRDEITVGFVINEIAQQTNTVGMVIPRDRRAQKPTVTIHQEAEKPTLGLQHAWSSAASHMRGELV